MTTLEAEIKLMGYLDIKRNLVVPNLTDHSTLVEFESDMLSLSQSGYATSYEIKVSKADLKNDLKKKHIRLLGVERRGRKTNLEFYYGTLKYFYYAVPSNLIETVLEQAPSFAGVLDLDTMKVVRKPTQLFPTKWTDNMRMQLARLGTMRILTMKNHIKRLKGRIKDLKTINTKNGESR